MSNHACLCFLSVGPLPCKLPLRYAIDAILIAAEPIANLPFCIALAFIKSCGVFIPYCSKSERSSPGLALAIILNSLTKKLKPGVCLAVNASPLTPVLANRKKGLAHGASSNALAKFLLKPVKS